MDSPRIAPGRTDADASDAVALLAAHRNLATVRTADQLAVAIAVPGSDPVRDRLMDQVTRAIIQAEDNRFAEAIAAAAAWPVSGPPLGLAYADRIHLRQALERSGYRGNWADQARIELAPDGHHVTLRSPHAPESISASPSTLARTIAHDGTAGYAITLDLGRPQSLPAWSSSSRLQTYAASDAFFSALQMAPLAATPGPSMWSQPSADGAATRMAWAPGRPPGIALLLQQMPMRDGAAQRYYLRLARIFAGDAGSRLGPIHDPVTRPTYTRTLDTTVYRVVELPCPEPGDIVLLGSLTEPDGFGRVVAIDVVAGTTRGITTRVYHESACEIALLDADANELVRPRTVTYAAGSVAVVGRGGVELLTTEVL